MVKIQVNEELKRLISAFRETDERFNSAMSRKYTDAWNLLFLLKVGESDEDVHLDSIADDAELKEISNDIVQCFHELRVYLVNLHGEEQSELFLRPFFSTLYKSYFFESIVDQRERSD